MRRLAPRTFAARAALFFAAAVLAMYWPVLKGDTPLPAELLLQFPPWYSMFDGRLDPMPELGDMITQFYPYRAFSGAHFRDGVMPLWNPHVFAGAPYQANPHDPQAYAAMARGVSPYGDGRASERIVGVLKRSL